MAPAQRAAVAPFVEDAVQDIDEFLAALSEWRGDEAWLADIYRRIEHYREEYPDDTLDEDGWEQIGRIPADVEEAVAKRKKEPGFAPSLSRMIRLVQTWRASAREAAECFPAFGLQKKSVPSGHGG